MRIWNRCKLENSILNQNRLNVFDHFVGLALKGLTSGEAVSSLVTQSWPWGSQIADEKKLNKKS